MKLFSNDFVPTKRRIVVNIIISHSRDFKLLSSQVFISPKRQSNGVDDGSRIGDIIQLKS